MPQTPTLDVIAGLKEDPRVIIRTMKRMVRDGKSIVKINRYLLSVGVEMTDDTVRIWIAEHLR